MKYRPVLLAAFSSVLTGLALPNELFHYGNPVLGFICFIPLFYALYESNTLWKSAGIGIFFGLLSSSIIYFWLMFFQEFSVWTLTGTAAAHALYFFLLFPILTTLSSCHRSIRPFLLAAAWTGYEFWKSLGYLAFPWGLAAYPAGDILPLIQIADVTGQWGVSFIVVLANALLFETSMELKHFTPALRKSWAIFLVIIIPVLLYGFVKLQQDLPSEGTFNVLLVQQNADSWVEGREMESIRIGQNLTRQGLKKASGPVDLIIWSENSFRHPYQEGSSVYRKYPLTDPFIDFLEEIQTPMLVGSPYILDWDSYEALNAVILIHPDGEIAGYYGKNRPVPFAEHVPFWDFAPFQRFIRTVIGLQSGGWAIGNPNVLLEITVPENRRTPPDNADLSCNGVDDPGGRTIFFGAPICFEDSFPDLCRHFIRQGADLLINLTNDSWSKTISGETQHYAAARFRSVETGKVLIRSTNAGVTTILDPHGRNLVSLPLYEEAFAYYQVPLYIFEGDTVYVLLGDFFPIILILFITGFIFITGWKQYQQAWPRRSGGKPDPAASQKTAP